MSKKTTKTIIMMIMIINTTTTTLTMIILTRGRGRRGGKEREGLEDKGERERENGISLAEYKNPNDHTTCISFHSINPVKQSDLLHWDY